MRTPKEVFEERQNINKQIDDMIVAAKKEQRSLSTDEEQKYDQLYARDMELDKELDLLDKEQKRADRRKSVEEIRDNGLPRNLVTGGSAADGKHERGEVTDKHRQLAMEAWTRAKYDEPLTDAQADAVELIRSQNRRFSVNSRSIDCDAYTTSEFAELQRQKQEGVRRLTKRDVDTTAGATLIPEGYIYTLESALLHYGPMWQVSEIYRTATGNQIVLPTDDDTSNEGEWVDEGATIGSTVDPTFGSVTFNAYKRSSGLTLVTPEMLEDSAFNLAEYVFNKQSERLARGTNRAFTVGDGNGIPRGIVNAAGTGVTTALSGAFAYEELIDLEHSVDVAYRNDPSVGYMMHDLTMKDVRKMVDGENRPLWVASIQLGVPSTLNGYPVFVNNHMETTGGEPTAAGESVMLFGAFRYYRIRQAGGMRLRHLTERWADVDKEGFIGFMRVDGDLVNTNAVKKMTMNS